MNQVSVDSRFPVSPVEETLAAIRECLDRIRFGSIAITLHEGKIVQFDITEKRRIGR